ncbi:Leucine-rich repeat-containing protein 23 [Fasciola hepatica]|uniref:Leucine-rich repeat-containing protein 23 n=1 Tax=Fasciola hepatica TaxID=6192 RepID=A0A4E0RIQ8_FASHE|nr:Leucine-rich repeat-containing protein 23 [Fasciola hepatica]
MLASVDLLETFLFLRHVNLAFNQLTDLTPLEKLHNLRELNASNNRIAKFPVGQWPSMTHLNLNNNAVAQLRHTCMPKLLILCLNNNQIRRLTEPETGAPYFTEENFPRLHTLQLAQNKLYLVDSTPNDPNAPNTLDIRLPRLRALFLGGNSLTSLAVYSRQVIRQNTSELSDEKSLSDETEPVREEIVKERDQSALGVLPELSVLNLRCNGLHELDGLTLETVPKLQYLNLRENFIDSMGEIEKLQQLPRLQTMIFLENPIIEMKDYRLEMRVTVPSLRRLDKDVYTEQENEEADLLLEQRRQEKAAADVSGIK